MSTIDIKKKKQQFELRFLKLGFDERKSQLAKFNIHRVKEILEQTDLPASGTMPLESMTLEEVKTETKEVMNTLCKGVGLKVDVFQNELQSPNQEMITELKRLQMLISSKKMTFTAATNQMLSIYKRNSKKAKVFDIPVEPAAGEDSMQGLALKGPIMMVGDLKSMAQKAPVYMETVFLGERYDKLSVGTYTHEIIHMLLDRHKGVVENYYNDEFLSIFMEKVAIDQIDNHPDKSLVKRSEVYRMAHVKKLLGRLDSKEEDSIDHDDDLKYIQSSLYAGILFDRYSKANATQKQAILEKVKSVLNGNTKLNAFIQSENLSLEGEGVFEYIYKVQGYAEELTTKRKDNTDFEQSQMSSQTVQIQAITNGNKIATELMPTENVQNKDE